MFTVYGPGITDPVSLERLLVRPAVRKTAAVAGQQAIKAETQGSAHPAASQLAGGQQKYQQAERDKAPRAELKAGQIMSTPVRYILSTHSLPEALKMLEQADFRHFPVLSPERQLIGMISDRDIVRCLCGSDSTCMHCAEDKQEILVASMMKDHVLSAHIDTDARHIARLFVEQRIGAMPITEHDQLVGMITRSDILRAVMVHFDLNLWS